MKTRLLFAVLFFVSAVAFIGCKKDKDKDEDPPPPEFEEISFDATDVSTNIPTGLQESENEYASALYDMISTSTDMSAFKQNLTPPENAVKVDLKSSETYRWSWSYGGEIYTFWWTFTEDDTKYYWTLKIQYNDGPKFSYIEAWETKDGQNGEIKYNFNWLLHQNDRYEPETTYYYVYNWEVDASGTYFFTFSIEFQGSEYTYAYQYEIVLYANGSGTLDYYMMDEILYHYEWDELGNGSVTYYLYSTPVTYSWTVTK